MTQLSELSRLRYHICDLALEIINTTLLLAGSLILAIHHCLIRSGMLLRRLTSRSHKRMGIRNRQSRLLRRNSCVSPYYMVIDCYLSPWSWSSTDDPMRKITLGLRRIPRVLKWGRVAAIPSPVADGSHKSVGKTTPAKCKRIIVVS
jgi:hypothetical protein